MSQANLNYYMLKRHVSTLVTLGFLEEKNNPHNNMLKTTGKGREFLDHYQNLQTFLEP